MPKQKRESRGVRGRSSKEKDSDDERMDSDDDLSQISENSAGSRARSERGGPSNEDAEDAADETVSEQVVESNFRDYVDGLTEKSANTRVTALKNLFKLLGHRVLSDVVFSQCDTLFDSLQRLISKRNGGTDEQALAARCIALAVIQMGCCDEAESRFREASATLRIAMMDSAVSAPARASCGLALAVGAFVLFSSVTDLEDALSALETVFSQSYLKDDGSAPVLETDLTQLHYSCLLGWSLLLTLLGSTSRLFDKQKERVLPRLADLLMSADVQLRICAGETIALFYEIARARGDEEDGGTFEFEETFFANVVETLKQLSVDSVKYRSKKDLRAQKRSFRDILRTVEDGDWEEETFHISKQETVTLDSWCLKRQYTCFCSLLGTGMNRHLLTNELLRDMFELGPVQELPEHEKKDKEPARASKRERRLVNMAASKARTKHLRDAQDKRRFHLSECGPDS